MSHRLVFASSIFDDLCSHLLNDSVEQAAFAFANVRMQPDGLILEVRETHRMRDSDFDHQSAFHIALTDEAFARVIRMAWERRAAALVEIHSHPFSTYPAAFSASDLEGFTATVPHVRWRLRGAPYAAVVLSPSSLDALIWHGPGDSPEPISEVVADGTVLLPTGITSRYLSSHE